MSLNSMWVFVKYRLNPTLNDGVTSEKSGIAVCVSQSMVYGFLNTESGRVPAAKFSLLKLMFECPETAEFIISPTKTISQGSICMVGVGRIDSGALTVPHHTLS